VAKHGTLTPEAQQIFGATYKVPEEILVEGSTSPTRKQPGRRHVILKRFLRRTEKRDPEVNEKLAPPDRAIASGACSVKGSYEYLKHLQPKLVINGDQRRDHLPHNSWILQQTSPTLS